MSGSLANIGVSFNLLTSAVKPQIDIIQSCYIDNTASPIPVYVHFPSTGMTISVAPATADWFPAVTEDLVVQVFAEGLVAGQIPTTQVMFTNVLVSPYSDPELNFAIAQGLASPSVTRGTGILNTNFGVPALGDQTSNHNIAILNTNVAGDILEDHLWGTPWPSGFIYLTHAQVSAIGTTGAQCVWTVDSVNSGGTTLYTFVNTDTPDIYINYIDLSAMNVKLDAKLTWQMRVQSQALAASTDLCIINDTWVWTQNPQ